MKNLIKESILRGVIPKLLTGDKIHFENGGSIEFTKVTLSQKEVINIDCIYHFHVAEVNAVWIEKTIKRYVNEKTETYLARKFKIRINTISPHIIKDSSTP
jgi:hypothetical protein